MEEVELEMSKEELQSLVRDQVENTGLTSPGLLEKYNLLQSLLIRREKETSDFLKLCQSVAACEEKVKELYSFLEWEYRDSDSDDESTGTGCTLLLQSEQHIHNSTTSNSPDPQLSKSKGKKKKRHPILNRKVAVVLKKLSRSQIIRALRRPLPQISSSENECLSGADSDMQWQPADESSDSSLSGFDNGSKKRRKTQQQNNTREKSRPTSQQSGNFAADVGGAKTRKLTARKSSCTTIKKTLTQHTSSNMDVKAKTAETTPQACTRKTIPEANTIETKTTEVCARPTRTPQASTRKTNTPEAETPETKTSEANSRKTKPSEANSRKTKPSEANTTKTTETITPKTKPSEANTRKTKPSEANTTKTTEANTRKTKPSEANTTKTTEANTRKTKPSEANTRKTKPSEANTRKTKPSEANTRKTKPSEANTTKTTEANTRKTKPSEANTTKTTEANTPKTKTSADKSIKTKTSDANTTKTSVANTLKTKTSEANTAKTKTPEANPKANAESKELKTCAPSANATVNPLNQAATQHMRTAPIMPPGEITLNMKVLARKRELSWQRGKITELITKDDGRLKYKVTFEEKGRILVSGHHIAFDCMPKVEQLFIGARVVVKYDDQKPDFMPGIMAELPNRKNRMRFLVFIDNETPVYVGLPLFHLVCKPLAEPFNDILNKTHQSYLRQYLKHWPYPPQSQYKVGQGVNVEFNGTNEKCEVVGVDCSMMEVSFKCDQHKEWLYRGSIRLEHMSVMRKKVMSNMDEEKSESDSVNGSSKKAH